MVKGAKEPGRLLPWLQRLCESRLFAYGTVLLLQAKLLWGIWDHRDLSPGDTGAYFTMASRWAEDLTFRPDFYPLYQLLWGSMQWIISGAYELTIIHRVLIALAVAALVLAVMRRLLTPGIAWLIAVWWVVLPVNYDTLYAVHLFALVPTMIAVLVAARWPSLAGRSAVFAILLSSALLTRNENIVAALVWGAAWIGYELWRMRGARDVPLRRLGAAVATPVVILAALVGLVEARSSVSASTSELFSAKHELNVCQVYALNRAQQGDHLVVNPLTECNPYMVRDFGREWIPLREAIFENPGAIADHFAWNARLFPAGIQVSLFDSAWPHHPTPGFVGIETEAPLALAGSLAVLTLLAWGSVLLWRDRKRWVNGWIRERRWAWIALLAVAASAVAAALLTRPRPAYLFNLTVLILALLGLCAMAIVHRWPRLGSLRAGIPPLALLLLIAVPNRYQEGYENPQFGQGKPVKLAVERLKPARDELTAFETGLLATPYPTDAACPYLGRGNPCTGIAWQSPVQEFLDEQLSEGNVDYVYADKDDPRTEPGIRRAVKTLERRGWKDLAPVSSQEGGWVLLRRPGL